MNRFCELFELIMTKDLALPTIRYREIQFVEKKVSIPFSQAYSNFMEHK